MTEKRDWRQEAQDDAKAMAMHYLDEMVEMLCGGDDVSDDILNDYTSGDSYHHEAHVDKEYDLLEASELLDALCDHEETDSGLWEGKSPVEAIECQAACTYGNAVIGAWRSIVEEINEDDLHCSVAAIKILGDNGWGDHLKVVAAAVLSSIINPEED